MLVLFSLACWAFIFWYHQDKKCDVPFRLRGCGGGGEEKQPEVQWMQSPQEAKAEKLWGEVQEPWAKSQYGVYQDVFEPATRALGGKLGAQLEQPLSLPEDVWANVWQQAKGRTAEAYQPLEQKATERAAGSGMLGQGPTEKYFQSLDLSQAKSMEDIAIDMAIQEWTEKKSAQQQAIQNQMTYTGYQPQFNLPLPGSRPMISQPEQDAGTPWGAIGTGVGAVAGTFMGNPMMGAQIGGSIGGAVEGYQGGGSSTPDLSGIMGMMNMGGTTGGGTGTDFAGMSMDQLMNYQTPTYVPGSYQT